jgi:uncharacterized protein YjiS (DUF1127 family)
MTNISPVPAAETRPHKPRLKPFAVRRHDLWAHPATPHHHHATAVPAAMPERNSRWWQPLLRVAGWPFRMIATAWRLQGEIRDLDVIDDHLLRDMGVTRGELRAAVRESRRVPKPDPLHERGLFERP